MREPTPHEAGYRAYQTMGRCARNPFERDQRSAEQWQRGFDKAMSASPTRRDGE